ncbi:MAG: 2,3-bisphosphoglycerate-dependent phosphoglycerate mutase [Oxalobacteraceae bacterium]|jgi:2,3-bisphosphoglycerate-dependent phosphoglycerate mutase|nr:MAG: 2,3-bisphosphoglycerate-dependent phosphoglycerate mutase [Oxalobacteraceae bacterium]
MMIERIAPQIPHDPSHAASLMQLVLLRHGESEWNRDNRFTGWADVGLTKMGILQMREAGQALQAMGVQCDVVYTSVLKRCVHATWTVLEAMDRVWVPQILDWRLNERHYGALTGQSKSHAVTLFGEAEVLEWRRSFDVAPPALNHEASAFVPIDGRYADLDKTEIPLSESLRAATARVQLCWDSALIPALQAGRSVLVVAHGNSLRALIKLIEGVEDQDITGVEVDNGVPVVYQLNQRLEPVRKTTLALQHRRPSEIL